MNFKPIEKPLIDWEACAGSLLSHTTPLQLMHIMQHIIQTAPLFRVLGEIKNEI